MFVVEMFQKPEFTNTTFGNIMNDCHYILKKKAFTPCKAEQPLRGMELQEKEAQKD